MGEFPDLGFSPWGALADAKFCSLRSLIVALILNTKSKG